MPIPFEHTYASLPSRFYARILPTPVVRPAHLSVNGALADLLGLDREELSSVDGAAMFAGNRVPDRAEPIALAYAGHQFGHFVPQLGDGRAILLGEIVGRDGVRRDIQLKGSGPTPFSRGGDGRAALGPVLREYVVSEAMAALSIPTTRALAAVTTGEVVRRETPLPGAVLARVASSHIRVGTFEYFAARDDREAVRALTRYALERHYPDASAKENPALALLESVMSAQARLVAAWISFGFVHGVMNTDNTSISGETIDYGPCAFLDGYDPRRTFSSIDRQGRYAYANQPRIALWNLARLAETLLPEVDESQDRAVAILTERLETFPERFESARAKRFRAKLGFSTEREGDIPLAEELLGLMAEGRVDFTLCFRRLTEAAAGGDDDRVAELFEAPEPFRAWAKRWRDRLAEEPITAEERASIMLRANPAFIPRNHRIEEMIAAATRGELGPFERLVRVLSRPFDDQPEHEELAEPPGESQWSYRTFCGT